MEVLTRPAAEREAEFPSSGGAYTSMEGFTERMLPGKRQVLREKITTVAGQAGREVTYDFTHYRITRFPPPAFAMRGRAVFFEANGYYYIVGYGARDSEFDLYIEVFDRAVQSFRFLE